MTDTVYGITMDNAFVSGYFASLVNRIFKILPIRERGETTLSTYLDSLIIEILGCESVLAELNGDEGILTLVSTFRYLRDNEDLPVSVVRREVFRAISVCKKIGERFEGGGAP